MVPKSANAGEICLECGLCCNGVIFADVQLQPGDLPDRLRELGLKLLARAKKAKPPPSAESAPAQAQYRFTQPCAAFDGCCRVYADRPHYCRAFECALLKSLQAGRIERSKAQRVIQTALRRADKVRKLLGRLGDNEETLALSKRFQRVQRRMEAGPVDEETGDFYGELTLAVQDLNVLLSDAFYPGAE
jgi:hypothetical protein